MNIMLHEIKLAWKNLMNSLTCISHKQSIMVVSRNGDVWAGEKNMLLYSDISYKC